jgi:hypothetical protein
MRPTRCFYVASVSFSSKTQVSVLYLVVKSIAPAAATVIVMIAALSSLVRQAAAHDCSVAVDRR